MLFRCAACAFLDTSQLQLSQRIALLSTLVCASLLVVELSRLVSGTVTLGGVGLIRLVPGTATGFSRLVLTPAVAGVMTSAILDSLIYYLR